MAEWSKGELSGAYDDMLMLRQCIVSDTPPELTYKLYDSVLLAGDVINKRIPRKAESLQAYPGKRFKCPSCKRRIKRAYQFCPKCGQFINWEGI